MSFQQTVSNVQAFGVPGTMADNSPRRAQSYILNSSSSALNIIGASAYTQTTEGKAAAGGTGVYVGLLANPHTVPMNGTTAGALQPTMTIANGYNAEFVTMGEMWVTLPAAAAIGDVVVYDTTTGVLSTINLVTALPVGKAYAYANVIRYTVSAAGTALIMLSPAAILGTPAA